MKTDNKTLDLIKEVNRQKAEISKAEKPNWITTCTFSYNEGAAGSASATNLHVETNIRNIICIASFLMDKERSYLEAAKRLGVEAPVFTWQGFSVNDWVEDIKMRINKIQISSKRKKLETLEARLNSVISPELKAEMELDAIESELK